MVINGNEKKKYTIEREKERIKVNEWIRTTKYTEGGFDSIIDFDLAIRDPENSTIINYNYDAGDGLHPNSKGYEKMAMTIDETSLFINRENPF